MNQTRREFAAGIVAAACGSMCLCWAAGCESSRKTAEPAAESRSPTVAESNRPNAPAPETVQVDNVSALKQAGRVYIAGTATPAGVETLKQRGVTTVVDFRRPEEVPEGYPEAVREMGLRYVSVPMKSTELTPEQAEAFLAAVHERPDETMLLQCASGNRSGAMYGLYVMDQQGAEPQAALEAARQAGMRNQRLAEDLRRYLEQRDR